MDKLLGDITVSSTTTGVGGFTDQHYESVQNNVISVMRGVSKFQKMYSLFSGHREAGVWYQLFFHN